MAFDIRTLAVPTAGFATFLNLYSPQALLPRLSHDFNVSAGEISSLITAATVAIALTAPFTGALADVLGRKRLITAAMFAIVVPTLLMTLASSVPQLVVLRFVQGLLVPPIFTVTVAYIGDEWPPGEVTRVAGLYTAGSSIGGFCGRLIPGLVTDLLDWRAAFAANALLTIAVAIAVAFMLPRERHFVRSEGLLASSRQILTHLRNPRLLAIYAVGFGVLFNFTSVFTYVNFHLAAPPYLFSSTLLGAIFVTYLAGSLLVPWIGRGVALLAILHPLVVQSGHQIRRRQPALRRRRAQWVLRAEGPERHLNDHPQHATRQGGSRMGHQRMRMHRQRHGDEINERHRRGERGTILRAQVPQSPGDHRDENRA